MSVLLYLDRFAISTAASAILHDLKLTEEEWGRVQSVFFLVYALLQVPAGWLSDRLGARITLALYVVGWSLATVAMGFANGLLVIVLMRIALGATQAGAYPAAASLLKRWIPATTRGRANTTVAMGGRAGGLIAFFCTPLLMLWVGQWLGWETGRWRVVLALYGSLGFVWTALFWWLYRDQPQLHPWCNDAEAKLIGESPPQQAKSAAALPVRALFRSPEVWIICGCNAAVNLGWIFLNTWLPPYLEKTYGDYLTATIGDKSAVVGAMTAMVGLAAICGGLVGGATTDGLVRAFGLAWGRRLPGMCAGVTVCVLYLIASQVRDVWIFVGLMVVIGFTIEFGLGASWAVYQDIAGKHVASVLGIGNMCGNLAAGAFAWLIGYLAKDGNWQTVFYISATAMACNSLLWFFFDSSRPIWKEQN
jgi:ACS family glucarate transporter-like MFS transporter